MLVEYARNVVGLEEAGHEEEGDVGPLVVTALSCTIAGQHRPIQIHPSSKAYSHYGTGDAMEPFYCNYGLNADFESSFTDGGLSFSARGDDDEVRILELDGHPFFMATLFVPFARSTAVEPHPLVAGFLEAAKERPR